MKTVRQTTIWTILIFIGLTLLTMKEEVPVDGINSYGFPLTFYTYFAGKCENCWDHCFKLLYLLADIALITVFTFLTIRLKNLLLVDRDRRK